MQGNMRICVAFVNTSKVLRLRRVLTITYKSWRKEKREMNREVLTIRVALSKVNYRDIEMPAETSLYKFAEVINFAYGFAFDYAFGFYNNLDDIYKSEVADELFADMGEPSVKNAA
jgi:hypothetical protein